MKRLIYLTITSPSLDLVDFNNNLPEYSKGEIKGRKKINNNNVSLVDLFWRSKDIDIEGEDIEVLDKVTSIYLMNILEEFNSFIQDAKRNAKTEIYLEIVSFYKIRFYDSCKDPCNDGILELDGCKAAGHHVCGQPFGRSGLSIDEKTIRLMAEVGVRLELNEYWDR